MISKEELASVARNTGLALYQQEKDYLLRLFLYFYYKQHEHAIFKGGTCLKYLFGLNRFSEDLDFTIKNPKQFQIEVQQTCKNITSIGIENYFIKEELFEDAYTCEIGFHGPLYTGTPQTRNKFRIDAGYRLGTIKKPQWKIIKSDYSEIEMNFLVLTMDLEEIFVEKVLAIHGREKGRDLYDLWFLIRAGVQLDRKLLEKKRKKAGIKTFTLCLHSKEVYERDMKRLTGRVIPYEEVRRAVENALKG